MLSHQPAVGHGMHCRLVALFVVADQPLVGFEFGDGRGDALASTHWCWASPLDAEQVAAIDALGLR